MFYYVYDEFIQDPKFERELALVETRLTDLGISGKIARLALFRDASELIRDEVRKGATTVVAVGNDLTLRKMIDSVADTGVALGLIPFGTANNKIAQLLGMPAGVAACDTLSARILESVDLGVVNGRRFIHSCTIPKSAGTVIHTESYAVSCPDDSEIEIRNLMFPDETLPPSDPTDGMLEFVIRSQERSWFGRGKEAVSFLSLDRVRISSTEPVETVIDGEVFASSELNVHVLKGHLQLVAGKGRMF